MKKIVKLTEGQLRNFVSNVAKSVISEADASGFVDYEINVPEKEVRKIMNAINTMEVPYMTVAKTVRILVSEFSGESGIQIEKANKLTTDQQQFFYIVRRIVEGLGAERAIAVLKKVEKLAKE